MARLKRLVLPGLVHHVAQRAVAGCEPFAATVDRELFLQALRRVSAENRVAIHAYVLLDRHFQLLATPVQADDLSRMMQGLSRLYVPAFNRRHCRTGALWEGRFRAGPVGGAEHLLQCMRYIEQAPRRDGLAGAMTEFVWSSAGEHAGTRTSEPFFVVPSESGYWRLGNTPFEREAAYADLLEVPLPSSAIAEVERTTRKGWAMGSGEFIASLAMETPRRAEARPRGRPPKKV